MTFGARGRSTKRMTKRPKSSTRENITLWKTVPIVEEQTVLRTSSLNDTQDLPFGQFAARSLVAGQSLDLDVTGDAQISGVVEAENSALVFSADGTITVQGLIPDGAADPDTLAAEAKLLAADTLTVSAGDSLDVRYSVASST